MEEAIVSGFDHEDFDPVISESRILAIDAKHGFISTEHLFVAMLRTDCLARPYLTGFDTEEHIARLQKTYPNTGTQGAEDSLPLTLHAERVIKHALHISDMQDRALTNSIHLLLAMLSYENTASALAKKKGIIYEDIAAAYFGQENPAIPVEIKLRHFKKPSRISSFLKLAPSMKKLMEDIYNHAESLWVYQQFDDCITTCQTGLELMPDHPDLKPLLVYSLLRKKDYKSAAGHLQQLINRFPDNLDYQLSLANCYDSDGDYLKAEEILDGMLLKIPDDDIVLNNKGFCLYQQGRYAEAVPLFEKAIQVNPSFAYPWDNLGFVKYKLGDTEQALTLIDKALELDKGNSYAYKYKGTIFLEQGNKTLAMENFQLALKYGFTKTYGDEVLQLIEKCK